MGIRGTKIAVGGVRLHQMTGRIFHRRTRIQILNIVNLPEQIWGNIGYNG